MRRVPVLIVVTAIIGVLFLFDPPVQSQSSTGGVWNNDGNFSLTYWDSDNHQRECYIAAPWGVSSWGVEGSTFSDSTNYALDWSRFQVMSPGQGYLYGKEGAGRWGSVRFIQGDAWGGSNCGAIPWNKPAPLPVSIGTLTLKIGIYRDTDNLLTSDQSWLMFANNVWLQSPELPKRLVLDLAFHHECNMTGCSLGSFEDDSAYHYQTFIGQTPNHQWRNWTINLSQQIDKALQTFNLEYVRDTLDISQLEFLIELRNAEGAASIDNFFLEYRYSTDPPKRNLYTTNTPHLAWNPITLAAGYRVEIDRVAGFNSPKKLTQDVTVGTLYVEPTLTNGSYYWRVRAQKSNGSWGAWSPTDTFVVDAP